MTYVIFAPGSGPKPADAALRSFWLQELARQTPSAGSNGSEAVSLLNLGCDCAVVPWSDVLGSGSLPDTASYRSAEDEGRLLGSPATEGAGDTWFEGLPADQRLFVESVLKELGDEALARYPGLRLLVRDLHRYCFDVEIAGSSPTRRFRNELHRRFRDVLQRADGGTCIVVAHGLGALCALDLLRAGAVVAPRTLGALLTLGAPVRFSAIRNYLAADATSSAPAVGTFRWIDLVIADDPVAGPAARSGDLAFLPLEASHHTIPAAPGRAWPHGLHHYLRASEVRREMRRLLPLSASASLDQEGRRIPASPALVPLPARIREEASGTTLAQWLQRLVLAGADTLDAAYDQSILALAERLRGLRMHREVVALATASSLQSFVGRHPIVGTYHAQALIEQSRLEEAEAVLNAVLEGAPLEVRCEALGLRGRISKQRYVSSSSANDLRRAMDDYLALRKLAPEDVWSAVNLVALANCAARGGVEVPAGLDADALAQDVIARVKERWSARRAEKWDLASIAEAYLHTKEFDLSELWFGRYLAPPPPAPFALNSTTRQLREIWRLRVTSAPGDQVLLPLERALAADGGTVYFDARAPQALVDEALEKVFAGARMLSVEALHTAMSRCAAVGQVRRRGATLGFGSGFAIPGSLLARALGPGWVFVTNQHVVSELRSGALRPEAAEIVFQRVLPGGPFRTNVLGVRYEPPARELDFSILALEEFPPSLSGSLEPYPVAESLPPMDENAQVYVIGHPSGGGTMFSLQENRLLDYGMSPDWRVHYRAPTQPGSSGSPVFDTEWKLVAVHHAGSKATPRIYGSGTYEANEGVAIQEIRRLLARAF